MKKAFVAITVILIIAVSIVVIIHHANQKKIHVPVAKNYVYELKGTSFSVSSPGVLGNEDVSQEKAFLVTGAFHGTIEFYTTGAFTYTPVAGFQGQDSFTYEICPEEPHRVREQLNRVQHSEQPKYCSHIATVTIKVMN